MATQTFSKSGSTITVNSYSTDNPPHYKITADDANHLVLINADDNSFNLQVNAALDTITINGESFSGTATELRTALLADIFVLATSGGAVVQTVYSLQTTITDAEFKALPSVANGFEVIPAPGVGKAIILLGGSMIINATAGAYTNVDADTSGSVGLRLITDNTHGDPICDIDVTGWSIRNSNPDPTLSACVPKSGVSDKTTYFENKNVVLEFANSAAGDLTGGDAANYVKFTLAYLIVTL